MDLHHKQEITVGALVMVAVAVFIAGFLWLSGRGFGAGNAETMVVRFDNVAGLRVGDPVQLSGVRVGRVSLIDVVDVGKVNVSLEIEREWRPKLDAKVSVQSLDFFGAKFVAYVPGSSSELLGNDTLTGSREVAITERAGELTDRTAQVLLGAQEILSERTAEDIHNTMVAVQRALNVMARLADGPAVREATDALKSVNRLATRLDSTLGDPAIGASVRQLDEITENIKDMTEGLATVTHSLGAITAKMDSSRGTLGRLVNDTTLHHDTHELMVSLKKLLDDIRERPGRYINVKVF